MSQLIIIDYRFQTSNQLVFETSSHPFLTGSEDEMRSREQVWDEEASDGEMRTTGTKLHVYCENI